MNKIFFHPSPNFDGRPNFTEISMIVVHHTEVDTERSLDLLTSSRSKVSSHYLIAKDGKIIQLVEETKRAWHAGKSYWDGKENINDCSIGIELTNLGHEPFPLRQMKFFIDLCKEIIERYAIKQKNIVGHSDVAPDRKIDPQSRFDWKVLHSHNIGLYPDIVEDSACRVLFSAELQSAQPQQKSENFALIQQQLREYGYNIAITGVFDDQSQHVIAAFKRHFRRKSGIYGNIVWDADDQKSLEQLLVLAK
ncbi:N-acetylmuramoyl-L-alanine amidase [Alphaproteobacteria bacterium]